MALCSHSNVNHIEGGIPLLETHQAIQQMYFAHVIMKQSKYKDYLAWLFKHSCVKDIPCASIMLAKEAKNLFVYFWEWPQ